MHLQLNEEQQFIQDTARRFSADELLPVAEQLDLGAGREPLLGNLKKLAELGFMGLNISADYGVNFAAALSHKNLFAVQFHPEKSADAGLQLLRNFCNWNG